MKAVLCLSVWSFMVLAHWLLRRHDEQVAEGVLEWVVAPLLAGLFVAIVVELLRAETPRTG